MFDPLVDILAPNEYDELINLVSTCYCPEKVLKPNGEERFGFFSLKRLYGNPKAFRRIIEILSNLIDGEAVCATDMGMAPMVGALAFYKQIPSVYVRSVPKHYYLSYGSRQSHNQPELAGECLNRRTRVQIFDDVLNRGDSVIRAISVLKKARLIPTSVLCILRVKSDQDAIGRIRNEGVNDVNVLLDAADIVPVWNRPS